MSLPQKPLSDDTILELVFNPGRVSTHAMPRGSERRVPCRNGARCTDDVAPFFNHLTEVQGLPVEAIEPLVSEAPLAIEPALLEQLKEMEKRGVQLAEQGKLPESIEAFSEAIAACEHYASAYNNRAQAYRLLGEVDNAMDDVTKAITYGQGDAKILRQAYTQRAILRRNAGDIEGSLADFERGARHGNVVAKAVAVNENPYAKMCNNILLEVMGREVNKGNE
ncbi:hypothetical protein BC936DRAFT_148804 [Jimgerdemannia flammicorona]|uniref:Uncharacterized protein n=1 Tax=Jimgerdemannia flammicorona TaxID=994334 RepID=A0A433DKI6_9FUNG|nr:hypothetical protein BC936DRAFT_148804 [Jimgerdemannia flammicorona]